jgi:hypothetical protein
MEIASYTSAVRTLLGGNMLERLLVGIALIGIVSTPVLAQTLPVPGPIVGAGLPGLIAGGVAAYAWYRSRKKR